MSGLALLLKQLSQHARRLELDIVEAINRLREAPLQQKHHMTHFTTLFTFYGKVVTLTVPIKLYIHHDLYVRPKGYNTGTARYEII